MGWSEDSYLFEHLLTREAAYSALLEHNRRALHSLAGDVLAARIVPGSLVEWDLLPQLAAHREAAGHFAEAHRRWCEVLRLAARIGRRERWEEFSQRAELCWRQGQQLPDAAAQSPYLLRARAAGLYARGDFAAALPLLEQALAQLPPDEPAEQGGLLLEQAQALHRMARIDEARPLYAEALARFEQLGDLVLQSEAQRGLGILARDTYQAGEALSRTETALELARRAGNRRQELVCLIAMSNAVSVFSSALRTQFYCSQALPLARELGDMDALATALQLNSELNSYLGLGEIGLSMGQESLHLARTCGNRRTECLALQSIGTARVVLGDSAGSRHSLDSALQLSRSLGHKWGEMQVAFHYGDALAALGNFTEAEEFYMLSAQLSRELGMGDGAQLFEAKAAVADLARGDLAAARRRLESFSLDSSRISAFWTLDVLYLLAQLEAQSGNPQLAAQWLDQATEQSSEFEDYPNSWPQYFRRRTLKAMSAAGGGS